MNELRPSGAEMRLSLAGRIWEKLGYNLHILSIGNNESDFKIPLINAGYTLHFINLNKNYKYTYYKTLKKINADILHLNNERLNVENMLLAKSISAKLFRTVTNSFPYTGVLRVKKIIERKFCRLLGCKYIAISKSVQYNEKYRLFNPSLLCWNWFNDRMFRLPLNDERLQARLDLGLQENEFVVVTVGNGNTTKNYSELIKALPLARYNTTRIKYLMVGHEHPEGMERQVAKEVGLEDAVVFIGPQSDIRKYLWAADVYAMPSLYEGFGLAAVEALATGVPCVLTNSPGLQDFKDFPLEITWTSPDSHSIAGALSSILQQRDLMQRNTKNAAFVRDYFGVERRAKAYADLWEQSFTE